MTVSAAEALLARIDRTIDRSRRHREELERFLRENRTY